MSIGSIPAAILPPRSWIRKGACRWSPSGGRTQSHRRSPPRGRAGAFGAASTRRTYVALTLGAVVVRVRERGVDISVPLPGLYGHGTTVAPLAAIDGSVLLTVCSRRSDTRRHRTTPDDT